MWSARGYQQLLILHYRMTQRDTSDSMENHIDRVRGSRPPGTPASTAKARSEARIRTPPPVALEYAEDVASRVSSRPVPVRNGFVERLGATSAADAPLAVMLRGGQGGAVRLKLLLAMLWFSVRAPHETSYPARGWAGLLGLDEYETNGARRVTAAIDWLESKGLVRVDRKPGVPSKVFLLDERATGEPYELPFAALEAKREAGEPETRDDYYVTLPADFFTRGWIAVLTGPGVAMLLVMVLEARYSNRTKGLWHSPAQATRRFGLSQDTRTAGLQELERYGIVDRRTGPVAPGVFDMRRRRNIYDLHVEQLLANPGQPRPAEELDVDQLGVAGTDAQELQPGTAAEPATQVAPGSKRAKISSSAAAQTTDAPKRPRRKSRPTKV